MDPPLPPFFFFYQEEERPDAQGKRPRGGGEREEEEEEEERKGKGEPGCGAPGGCGPNGAGEGQGFEFGGRGSYMGDGSQYDECHRKQGKAEPADKFTPTAETLRQLPSIEELDEERVSVASLGLLAFKCFIEMFTPAVIMLLVNKVRTETVGFSFMLPLYSDKKLRGGFEGTFMFALKFKSPSVLAPFLLVRSSLGPPWWCCERPGRGGVIQ